MTNKNALRIIGLSAVVALGGCAGGSGQGSFADLSYYDRGKQHLHAGQLGLAVKYFRSAVDREPASVEALNALAATYDRLGRFELATRYYERALAADPDSTQTLNNIGYSYLLQKRFDLAVAYLRDAHRRGDTDPTIFANRKVAEVALQNADLERSASQARGPESAGAPPAVPVEPVAAEPLTRITVASARSQLPEPAPRGPVKPWIERTAPKVQSLVTQPQTVMAGIAERAGVSPQIAAYRPQREQPEELLPDPLSAPLALDETAEANADLAADEPPAAPDTRREAPVTGLAPEEVAVASVDPLAALGGERPKPADEAESAARAGSLSPEATLANLEPWAAEPSMIRATAAPALGARSGLLPAEVTVVSLQPLHELVEDALVDTRTAAAAPLTGLLPIQVTEVALSATEAGMHKGAARPDSALTAEPTVTASLRPTVTPMPEQGSERTEPAALGLPMIEVSNGTGRLNMAARMRGYLEDQGVVVRRLTNADNFRHMETTIFYRAGWQGYAEELARRLPAVIDLAGPERHGSDIRIELGGDLLDFDRGLYYAGQKPSGGHSG